MWTKFIKLADKNNWYDDDLCYNGPSCYELAIAGSHDESLKIVHVGETANERRRMIAYGSHGSHLSEIIDWHLERGWYLFYRAVAKNTKEEAKKNAGQLTCKI